MLRLAAVRKYVYRNLAYLTEYIQDKEVELLSDTTLAKLETNQFLWEPPKYEFLADYFFRFSNSKSHKGLLPNRHLMFIIGMQSIGKTKFINDNLARILQQKSRLQRGLKVSLGTDHIPGQYKEPEVQQHDERMRFSNGESVFINIDLLNNPEKGNLSFQAMLHRIESTMIQQLLKADESVQKNHKGKELLTKDIVLEVLFDRYCEEYFSVYLKDYMNSLLQDTEVTLLSEEQKERLQEVFDEMVAERGTVKLTKERVYQILETLEQDHVPGLIQLILGVMRKIEFQHRPQEYTWSNYRTGIQTTNFIFDLFNFATGLHPIIKRYVDKIFYEDLSPEQQQKYSKNFVFSGQHVDTMLCLSNLFRIACSHNNKQFADWFDHIMLRCHQTSGFRTHFPVVVELDSTTRLKDLYRLGQINPTAHYILDLHGYNTLNVETTALVSLFKLNEIFTLFYKLGHHPYTWYKAIRQMVTRNISLKDVKAGKLDFLNQDKKRLDAQLNLCFTSPKLIPLLDEGSAQFYFARHLGFLLKIKSCLHMEKEHYIFQLLQHPVGQVLIQHGVTYQSLYYAHYMFTEKTDAFFLKPIVKEFRGLDKGWRHVLKYMQLRWRVLGLGYRLETAQLNYWKEKRESRLHWIERIRKKEQNPIPEYFTFRDDEYPIDKNTRRSQNRGQVEI